MTMPELSEETWTVIMQYATRVVGVVVLLFVAWIISGWVARIVRRSCDRAKIDLTLGKFFAKMAKWAILVMAVLACLGVFGVNTTSFAAVLAAVGLAVGLALQGSLSNFASGVMLLIFRPFKVGDVVTVNGVTGKVDEIELFTTTLDTPDNRRLILPNSAVFGTTIENMSHHDTRRVDVAVGVDYSADIDKTRSVLEAVAAAVPDRLVEPAPQIVLTGLGASSVDWTVRVWSRTSDYWAMKEAVTRQVKIELDNAGIGIPYPQMDVHLDGTVTRLDGTVTRLDGTVTR